MLLLLSIIIGVASLQIITEHKIAGRLASLNDAEQEIAWAHSYHERMLRIAGAAKSYSLSARDAFHAAIEGELALFSPLDRQSAVEAEQLAAISGERPEAAFVKVARKALAAQVAAHRTIEQAQQHFGVVAGTLANAADDLTQSLEKSGEKNSQSAVAAIKQHMVKLLRFGPKLATERDPEHLDRLWAELNAFDTEISEVDLRSGGRWAELMPKIDRFERERDRMSIAVSFLRGAFMNWTRAASTLETEIDHQRELVQQSIVDARAQARNARLDVQESVEASRRFGLFALAAGVMIWASVSAWLRQTVVRPLNAVIDALAHLAAHQKAPQIEQPRLCELRRLHATIAVFARGFSQIRAMTANLSRMAALDPLTGAQNRRSLPELFRTLVDETDFTRQQVSLIVVDVDNFKQLNDTHGHDAGDRVLVDVVAAMRSVLRESDLVGRLGGDEFVLVARGPVDADVGALVSERLTANVAETEALQRYSTPVTLSIGYAEASSAECDFDVLLKQADIAVYEAKARGRATHVGYCSDIDERRSQRRQVLAEIERALDQDQIVPVYQPKINLETRALCGFEALARWRCPERGLLTPDHFGEALQNPELGARISSRILERALAHAAAMRGRGVDMMSVSVNVTQKQLLADDVAERMQDLCFEAGLTPDFLELEISERLVAAPLRDQVAAALERLSSLKIGLTIDDFGAGAASLQQLRDPLISSVKIDLSLVARLRRDPKTLAMVAGMVRLSQALGLRVIAEGVENQETAELLRDMGCDRAQGYLFGRPTPIEEVPDVVAQLQGGQLALLAKPRVSAIS